MNLSRSNSEKPKFISRQNNLALSKYRAAKELARSFDWS
jgi:hypothetical protein